MVSYKFWFYCRKAFFQGVVPSGAAILTFYDLVTENNKDFYKNIYIYTSFLLFIYSLVKITITFISDICGVNIVFRKEPENELSEQDVENAVARGNFEMLMNQPIIIIKRVFKLHYSEYYFFKFLSNFCWAIGMDCPIIIPRYFARCMKDNMGSERANELTPDQAIDLTQSCVNSYFGSNNVIMSGIYSNHRVTEEKTQKINKQIEHIKKLVYED